MSSMSIAVAAHTTTRVQRLGVMKRGLLLEVVAETIPAAPGGSQGGSRTGRGGGLPKRDAYEPKPPARGGDCARMHPPVQPDAPGVVEGGDDNPGHWGAGGG